MKRRTKQSTALLKKLASAWKAYDKTKPGSKRAKEISKKLGMLERQWPRDVRKPRGVGF